MNRLEAEMLYASGRLGSGAIVIAFGFTRKIDIVYRDINDELIMKYLDDNNNMLYINVRHITKVLRYSDE
ncbi:MAG TPA: hypothetical protein VK190_03460 [Pseudoneobacillus sp.]|nr:hypothetical protein [Pseudoneobacillus sp.]